MEFSCFTMEPSNSCFLAFYFSKVMFELGRVFFWSCDNENITGRDNSSPTTKINQHSLLGDFLCNRYLNQLSVGTGHTCNPSTLKAENRKMSSPTGLVVYRNPAKKGADWGDTNLCTWKAEAEDCPELEANYNIAGLTQVKTSVIMTFCSSKIYCCLNKNYGQHTESSKRKCSSSFSGLIWVFIGTLPFQPFVL